VNRRRTSARKWRLRGRRGQVSAIATILGLLLVVTFIANYLTTTLPNEMSVNDLNHIVQVENQVGRFQALLEAASADDAIGAQLTQPITLGSIGVPPFASTDPATVGPANASSFSLNSTLGTTVYAPPTGGVVGGVYSPCTLVNTASAVSLTCGSAAQVTYNFTSTPTSGYTFTLSGGGTYFLNITTNGASTGSPEQIKVISSGAAPLVNLNVIGNNDTVTFTQSTASNLNLVLDGNYDTLIVQNTAAVFSSVQLYESGLHDATSITGAQDLTFLSTVYGSTDTTAAPTTAATTNAATDVQVYYVGVTPPTALCPTANQASTDSVSGGDLGTYHSTYNVTSHYTPPVVLHWTQTGNVVAASLTSCPFYSVAATGYNLAPSSAGLNVHLINTYLPQADVAFDEGAVIYAQPGGIPLMIDSPGISVTQLGNGNLSSVSIWFPVFVGKLPIDSGVSTAEVAARLTSLNTLDLTPGTAQGIDPGQNITITIVTPFAAAWDGYFNSTVGLENDWSCSGPSVACNGPYSSGGPVATVTLSIPTSNYLNYVSIQVATFWVSMV
jgi:hypothetical protein